MRSISNVDLVPLGKEFQAKLKLQKERLATPRWEWYPYDSLSNLVHARALLKGPGRQLTDLMGDGPVADVGCGDGDLAFFLESLGLAVDAIDNPVTHHNGMEGIRTLRDALGSGVNIHQADLDEQWSLVREHYSLVFLMGVLYHLKNPIYTLEQIAKHSRYLVLSTRIAKHFPGVKGALDAVPAAYLVAADELNEDNSNYWIFTDAGLRRVLERASWRVLDVMRMGDTRSSNPVDSSHDERAYYLVESHYALANVALVSGFHQAEGAGWRWTEGRFVVRKRHCGRPFRVVTIKAFVPHALVERRGVVTLRLESGGQELLTKEVRTEGDIELRVNVPSALQNAEELEVAGVVDPVFPPDEEDGRERGLIVASIDIED